MQKIIFHQSLTSAAGMTKAEQFIENQNHNQARNMQITISSGNYNFFNVLTMVLCIPCIEQYENTVAPKEEAAQSKNLKIIEQSPEEVSG